jgi:hypothetical protein
MIWVFGQRKGAELRSVTMRKNIIGEYERGHDMSNEGIIVNFGLSHKRVSKVV